VYDLASMSCSYVLAGHTDIVLCLDTCVSNSGRTLLVTGSKDNNVSSPFFFFLGISGIVFSFPSHPFYYYSSSSRFCFLLLCLFLFVFLCDTL
jgi:hypothetical protein